MSAPAPTKKSSIHAILPRVAMGCLPFMLVLLGIGIWGVVQTFRLPADADVFELLAGKWAGTRGAMCDKNPHIISFSPDRRTMMHSTGEGVVIYDVLEHDAVRLRGVPRVEDGERVAWDLKLRGPDMLVWHKADQPEVASGEMLLRCGTPWSERSATPRDS